jgi:hypothetical protein
VRTRTSRIVPSWTFWNHGFVGWTTFLLEDVASGFVPDQRRDAGAGAAAASGLVPDQPTDTGAGAAAGRTFSPAIAPKAIPAAKTSEAAKAAAAAGR